MIIFAPGGGGGGVPVRQNPVYPFFVFRIGTREDDVELEWRKRKEEKRGAGVFA